jgi:hypothetical protein
VGAILIKNIRGLASVALVGLLLIWILPGWTRRLVDTVRRRPLPAFGWVLAIPGPETPNRSALSYLPRRTRWMPNSTDAMAAQAVSAVIASFVTSTTGFT